MRPQLLTTSKNKLVPVAVLTPLSKDRARATGPVFF